MDGAGFVAVMGAAFTPALSAQAAPAVLGGDHTLWYGVEYSNLTPDFGPPQRLIGVGGYVDYNGTAATPSKARRGSSLQQINGEYEDNYWWAPRSMSLPRKIPPLCQSPLGVGRINFPYEIGNGSYFAIAPGGGLDYRLTRRINLRAEYEYQFWPAAPGIAGEPSNGLKPDGFSAGFAYRFR